MVSSFVARQLGLRGFKPEAGTPRTERFRNATVREAAGWSDFDPSHYDALKLFLASDAIHRPDKRSMLEATMRWCFDHRLVRPGLTMIERLLASVGFPSELGKNGN